MHVGQKIKEVMKDKKIPAVEVAKAISCERTNLYNIFERQDINTSLLKKLCIVLDYDFFNDLSKETFENTPPAARKAEGGGTADEPQ